MNFTNLILHSLEGLLPSVVLTASLLLFWGVRGRLKPVWGYAGTGLVLFSGGVLTQIFTLWVLRWPDGSLASYGVLIAVLATLGACLTRPRALS